MKAHSLFYALCVLSLLFGSAETTVSQVPEQESLTYIIPIEGVIEKALLYVIRRGVQQAKSENADALIFVIDTPGGRLDAADEIVRLILSVKMPTYTFVKFFKDNKRII